MAESLKGKERAKVRRMKKANHSRLVTATLTLFGGISSLLPSDRSSLRTPLPTSYIWIFPSQSPDTTAFSPVRNKSNC
jgi:hypothetical protein